MKRLFITLLALSLLLMSPSGVWAAGTVTDAGKLKYSKNVSVLTYSWTADASAATVPATASTIPIDGYVFMVVTNPGATAPTTLYDITLTDSDGVDIMGGELADRHTSNSEQAFPLMSGSTDFFGGRFVAGVLTLNVTNNSVNSATGTVVIYISNE